MKYWIYCLVGIIFISLSCQDKEVLKLEVNSKLRDSILSNLSNFDNSTDKESSLKKHFNL